MKIAFVMKSELAYQRLSNELGKDEAKHLKSLDDVKEAIQYSKPDIVVLDKEVSFFEDAEKLLLRFNVHIVEFDKEFAPVIEQIKTQSVFFSDEEEEYEKYIPDHVKYMEQLKKKVEKPTEQKIIYREKIVEKEIERISFTSIPPKLIVIGSLWAGAGSTTISVNLARAIASRGLQVSLVEYPTQKPYLFDYLDIHNKEDEERGKIYFDHAQLIKSDGHFTRDRNWNEKGISWYVNDSRFPPVKNFSFDELLKLIYSISTPIKIIDISTKWNDPTIRDLLHQADEIFVCVEPDPIKVDWLAQISINGQKTDFQRMENRIIDYLTEMENLNGVSFQYITTKVNDSIDMKEWHEDFIFKESLVLLDNIPYEDHMRCVWKSTFLYDNPYYKEMFEYAFKPIFKRVLPLEFHLLEQDKHQKKSIKNIFSNLIKKGEG
ncbi:hypothetical protein [Niallia sp. FSL R7-0271]|uniref:hypothetical protein n=1 Tax=Niallia sp. FSL R7-0271 TaxID=2921678 RepID=UPI0030F62BC7